MMASLCDSSTQDSAATVDKPPAAATAPAQPVVTSFSDAIAPLLPPQNTTQTTMDENEAGVDTADECEAEESQPILVRSSKVC